MGVHTVDHKLLSNQRSLYTNTPSSTSIGLKQQHSQGMCKFVSPDLLWDEEAFQQVANGNSSTFSQLHQKAELQVVSCTRTSETDKAAVKDHSTTSNDSSTSWNSDESYVHPASLTVDLSKIKDESKVEESDVIKLLSKTLMTMAASNSCQSVDCDSPFVGDSPARISVYHYVRRLVSYLNDWEELISTKLNENVVVEKNENEVSLGLRALITGFIYLDRMSKSNSQFVINNSNVHRLLLTSMMLATKCTEDSPISISFMAKVGGVGKLELKKLECTFCSLIKFDLYVLPEHFSQMYDKFVFYVETTIKHKKKIKTDSSQPISL